MSRSDRERLPEWDRLDSYWFRFEESDTRPARRILCAITRAGKMFHCTSRWGEAGWEEGDPETPAQLIERVVNEECNGFVDDLLATRQREREKDERIRELESDKQDLAGDLQRWARKCGEVEAEKAELVEALRPFALGRHYLDAPPGEEECRRCNRNFRDTSRHFTTKDDTRTTSVSKQDEDRARRLVQRAESEEGGS